MEKIAFIFGDACVYWSSLILFLAALGSALLFLGCYTRLGGDKLTGVVALLLAAALSLPLSRLVHWYCHYESYRGFLAAMTDYSQGGYALPGAFAGCLLAALGVGALGLTRDVGRCLDAMSLAGCAGIAAGRLSCLYNAADRGQLLEKAQGMPWAYPVVNAVSGATEYRLATFLLQSLAAALLFCGLCGYARRKKPKSGEITLLFLLFYCAFQVVLDSTRYDSMYFRSNGFVSVVQVLSALTLGGVIVLYSWRLVKNQGFRWGYLPLWTGIGAAIGCAGYMEYYVQRHGSQAAFAYGVMTGALTAALGLSLVIRAMAEKNVQTAQSSN